MFRITGGSVRGRKLKGPVGFEIRPTAGLVKNFIFSSLFVDIREAKILDLFAGVGSLGLEALSRGAKEVVFVENNPAVLKILKNNIRLCGFSTESKLHGEDVFYSINKMKKQEKKYDLIFADPPYQNTLREQIVRCVDQNDLLKPGGLLILEHGKDDPDPGEHGVQLLKQKAFGHCIVSIYGEDEL